MVHEPYVYTYFFHFKPLNIRIKNQKDFPPFPWEQAAGQQLEEVPQLYWQISVGSAA